MRVNDLIGQAKWIAALLLLAHCAALAHAGEKAAVPERVISMAPSITEIVFALGGGGQLVGVGDFCEYPAEAAQKRRCGGWSNPNYEVISSLQPQLILIQGLHQKMREFAETRGINFQSIELNDVATIESGIKQIGALIGRDAEATSLSATLARELDAFERELREQHPDHRPPSVLLCIGRQENSLTEISTAAAGSFLDQALTIAGGRNLFADLKQPYPQISKESLIARRPDVILEIRSDAELSNAQIVEITNDWNSLKMLPAVANKRVHVLHGDYFLIPGPRLPLVVRDMRSALLK